MFREQEDRQGYFELTQQLVERYGLPLALYHDRHEIFPKAQHVDEAASLQEQLAGGKAPSQFGRLLQEVAITSIAARSPQAKGRVERLFGTLQDRLVVELRLAKACTWEQANVALQAYLPRFNARFAVPAAQPETAYRPWPAALKPEEVFCFKYERVVAADNTIQFGPQRIQLEPNASRSSFARVRVQVHEQFDGRLLVMAQGRCVSSTPAPLEAKGLRARGGRLNPARPAQQTQASAGPGEPPSENAAPAPKSSIPRADHPWRKPFIASKTTESLNTSGDIFTER